MTELTRYDPAVWEYVYERRLGTAGPDISHIVRVRRKRQESPELVLNSTFTDNIAGWAVTQNATAVWDNGTAEITTPTGGNGIYQSVPTEIGAQYIVKGDFIDGTGRIRFGTSVGDTSQDKPDVTNGTFEAVFTATASAMFVYARIGPASTAHVDNISVRKV